MDKDPTDTIKPTFYLHYVEGEIQEVSNMEDELGKWPKPDKWPYPDGPLIPFTGGGTTG